MAAKQKKRQQPAGGGLLGELAAEMRGMLESGRLAWVQRSLSGGLEIVLQRRNDGQWRLAIARQGVDPHDGEMEICRRFFQVPDAAEPARTIRASKHPKTGRQITYHVIEVVWVEVPVVSDAA